MLARLIDGRMIPCPKQGRDGRGGLHTDLPRYYADHPHRCAEDGYYPVRFAKRPAGDPAMGWTLRNGEIIQVWTENTPRSDDPILARLDRIEDCLLKISARICA